MSRRTVAAATLSPIYLTALFYALMCGVYVPAALGQAQVQGQWQTLPYMMPVNPIHVSLLHTGQVLAVGGSENYPPNFDIGQFRAALWNPQSGNISIQNLPWDMFCTDMVNLPDGRILQTGGNIQYDPFLGSTRASAFDPATNQYVDVQNMAHGRWYPTSTVLGD